MRPMKDSGIEWIGEIPQDWEISRVKRSFDVVLGKMLQPTAKKESDQLLPYMCSANITWAGIDLSVEKTMWYSESEKEYYLLKHGDLLVTEGGDVAVSCIWRDELPVCCIQNAVHRVRPRGNADNRFLYYWMSTLKDNGYIDMVCNKATLAHFTKEKIDNCVFIIPPAYMQKKIADYLDTKCAEIDDLIIAKEKTNALLKERRQSLIYEAVTKGLDPTVPMKDSGIPWLGQIPESWTTWRMKHLAESPLQYGANATGIEYDSDLPRYVRITDITDDGHLRNEGKQSLPYDIAADYLLVDGDVLFARSGATSGKSFYYHESDGNCCFAGYLIRFRADKNKVNSKLLYYYTLTQAYEQWTQQIFIQATIQNISAEKYNNLIFAIPATMEEQNQIVRFLDAKCAEIDQIISANENTVQRLKEYRQSLIYEAVTGKIEVENV